MNTTNYFDLRAVFINELVGDIWLFIFLGLLVILVLSLKNRISWQPLLLICVAFMGIVFAANTGLILIWILAVLATGGLFYYGITRLLNR